MVKAVVDIHCRKGAEFKILPFVLDIRLN